MCVVVGVVVVTGALLSPNVHLYDTIERPLDAVEFEALNDTVSPRAGCEGENVKTAVGGGVALLEFTGACFEAVPVCPRSSVTIKTTL